jgi:ligand-binding sensor domain-containing protein
VTQYRVDFWTKSQGLPQVSVLAIAQDQAGFLWLGMQEGIARFDGVAFEHFTIENTPELGSNYVNAILADATGRLWFGTDAGTLAPWSRGRFSAFATSPEFRGRVVGIESDADGAV